MVRYGLGTFAGLTMGLAVPYVILSRADNVETRLQSIALCSIASERLDMSARKTPAFYVHCPPSRQTCRVLVVKRGPDSTSVAVFRQEKCLVQEDITRGPKESSADVCELLREHGIEHVDAVVTPGEPSGTRRIAQVHADQEQDSGIAMAIELAQHLKAPAFAAGPALADEFAAEATLSGNLVTVWAAAVQMAEKTGLQVEQTCYVVADLSDEITVAAVSNGRIADSSVVSSCQAPDVLIYRIAKAIGSMCVAAGADAEAIVLTGGMALDDEFSRPLKKRLSHLLPVLVVRDPREMAALARAACRALCGGDGENAPAS